MRSIWSPQSLRFFVSSDSGVGVAVSVGFVEVAVPVPSGGAEQDDKSAARKIAVLKMRRRFVTGFSGELEVFISFSSRRGYASIAEKAIGGLNCLSEFRPCYPIRSERVYGRVTFSECVQLERLG